VLALPGTRYKPVGCADRSYERYVGVEQGTLGYGYAYETLQSLPRSTWFNRASEVDASVLLKVVQEGIRT
jgi:hypothetical protein